jgi:hypothetical protein
MQPKEPDLICSIKSVSSEGLVQKILQALKKSSKNLNAYGSFTTAVSDPPMRYLRKSNNRTIAQRRNGQGGQALSLPLR